MRFSSSPSLVVVSSISRSNYIDGYSLYTDSCVLHDKKRWSYVVEKSISTYPQFLGSEKSAIRHRRAPLHADRRNIVKP